MLVVVLFVVCYDVCLLVVVCWRLVFGVRCLLFVVCVCCVACLTCGYSWLSFVMCCVLFVCS